MHTPSPSPLARPPPDLTPAPAVLRALAHVAEVDLAQGLGRRRLAQVIRGAGPRQPARRVGWVAVGLLLVAAAAALLLSLR